MAAIRMSAHFVFKLRLSDSIAVVSINLNLNEFCDLRVGDLHIACNGHFMKRIWLTDNTTNIWIGDATVE